MEHMYDILKPDGEVLLVFLASNPIFTMYERMAERTEWAEYMKVISFLKLFVGRFFLHIMRRLYLSFRMLISTCQIINILPDQQNCLPQRAIQ